MPVSSIKPKITDAGLTAAVNAKANGFQLAITHVALGTGTYDHEASGAGMTNMVARKEKCLIDAGVVSGTGAFKVAVNFGSWTGTTYPATELAFWAGDPDAGGVLFAVWSTTTDKLVDRNLLVYVASFVVQLVRVPADAVTIALNPNADEVIALIALHENRTDPHSQYLKKSGDSATGPIRGLTASQHDDSTLFSTTAFLHRNGLRYPNVGGLQVSNSPFALQPQHLGRWIELASNNGIVNLPAASDCPPGATYSFRVTVAGVNVVPNGNDVILNAQGDAVSLLKAARGETFVLARNSSNNWYVVSYGMRMPAGMVGFFIGNNAPPGWLKINGALLSRAAYPDLWTYAQSTGGVVSEAEWLNGGYSGRYSSGTDGTNFRLPDVRGVFLRAFDDGRGIDAGREWGKFQNQDNLAHTHGLTDPGHNHVMTDPGHNHAGITDERGYHNHGINDPGHSHGGGSALDFLDYGYNGGVEDGRGQPDWRIKQIVTAMTGLSLTAGGQHVHNLVMQAAMAGIAINPATSGITMQAQGSESRPSNVAFGAFVKY